MRSAALSYIQILAAIFMAIVLTACGAGTALKLDRKVETVDASGRVTERTFETVERSARAFNTKVELKDLESTVEYGGTNGLASGLSAGDVSALPETAAIQAFQQGLGMAAAFYGVQQGGQSDQILPIVLELIRAQTQPPPSPVVTNAPPQLSESDLANVRALLDELEAVKATLEEE